MKETRLSEDKGQTLVTVALLMVVLLIFLALAIDVGHIYAERRFMQNAADAGALEGARQICFENASVGTAEAIAASTAQSAVPGRTLNATASVQGWTVTVTTTEAADTYVAGIIGLDTVDVPAVAAAVCGGADVVCGLWPVGLSQSQWDEIYSRGCGKTFYVWSGNNPNQDPDCSIYDCDVDEDGIDDVINMQGRSWLDFSDVVDPLYNDPCVQSGCGTSELSCWIENDSPSRITIPACVPGDNGVRAGTKDEVEARIGDSVSIPLFDSMGCAGISCPGGNTYHIVGLGCVIVEGWEHNFELPRLDGANPSWKDKMIVVRTSCGTCNTNCGSTSGTPPIPGGVNAVSLIR